MVVVAKVQIDETVIEQTTNVDTEGVDKLITTVYTPTSVWANKVAPGVGAEVTGDNDDVGKKEGDRVGCVDEEGLRDGDD